MSPVLDSGDELGNSEAHLTVSDGRKTLSRNLPVFTDATPGGASFWFVGCLRIVGGSFVFSPVDSLSRESPYKSQKLYCLNLQQSQGPVTQDLPPPFCKDASLRLRLLRGQSSLYQGTTLQSASIKVLSTEGGTEQVAEISGLGDFSVKIVKGGKYLVEARGEGAVGTQEEFTVFCDLTKCEECSPTHVISMSPDLEPAQARVMLSWSDLPNKLKLHVFLTESKQLPEIEDNSFLLENSTVGMIFVENYDKVPAFSTVTNARLSLFSSTGQAFKHDIDLTNYGNEIYWLAGCFRNDNGVLNFTLVSFFLNTAPNLAEPDFCNDP